MKAWRKVLEDEGISEEHAERRTRRQCEHAKRRTQMHDGM